MYAEHSSADPAGELSSYARDAGAEHSTRLYNIAIGYNKGLDRDHDGIACEQH